MDPKSIEEKQQISVTDGAESEEGNAVSATSTIINTVPADYSELKFLFFGTSRTYGAMLEDRATQAFPFLLGGANALNLGIPSGGPDHPLACTYSMLLEHREESFDVIVLEYQNPFFSTTLQLAKRLRQRFPNALILFLDMWLMAYFQNIPSGKSLDAWSLQRGFATSGTGGIIGPRLTQRVMNKTRVEDWFYLMEELAYSDSHKKRISHKGIEGYVVTAPIPANAHEALSLPFREFFFRDMTHYSEKGHEYVANLIRTYLSDELHFRTFHDPTVAPWEHTDQCNHWLKTGIIDPTLVTSFPPESMALNEFNPLAHKFALEVREPKGWFTVQNNIEGFAQLTIEYMITGPECFYPEMKISIQTSEAKPLGEVNEPMVLGCAETPYPHQVHISHQVRIGTIPPGGSTVILEAVNEQDPAAYAQKWPFRIIAVSLTPVSAFSQNPVTSRFHVS